MLRQPRPKSQPPIKFASSSAASSGLPKHQTEDRQWNQLIDRYQQQRQVVQASSRLSSIEETSLDRGDYAANGVSGGHQVHLSPTACELSSASSSASSSPVSSLASSTLSISTESSTSTVLNTHIQINRSKSMIARYSQVAPAAAVVAPSQAQSNQQVGASNKLNQIAPSQQQQQMSAPVNSEDEEDEPSQALSSSASSTTSSSSGLSSMNSSSHATSSQVTIQQQQQGRANCFLATNSGGVMNSGQFNLGYHQHQHQHDYNEAELEAGKCLSELVDSVSAAEAAQAAAIAANEIEYTSFQLHEAVLAQTRSSGSSDEGCSSPSTAGSLLVVKPLEPYEQQMINCRLPLLSESPAGPLVAPTATAAAIMAPIGRHTSAVMNSSSGDEAVVAMNEAYLVRSFELESGSLDDSLVLELARHCISAALQEQQLSKSSKREPPWLVCLRADESAIEWHQIESTRGHQIESAHFSQILDCLLDGQLVVWILNKRPLSLSDNQRGRISQQQQGDGSDLMETTLDDIALALDEPIGGSNAVGYNNNKLEQATAVYGAEALVWLCSSEKAAKRFGDTYRFLMASNSSRLTLQNDDDEQQQPVVGRPVNKSNENGEHLHYFEREIDYLRATSTTNTASKNIKPKQQERTNDLVSENGQQGEQKVNAKLASHSTKSSAVYERQRQAACDEMLQGKSAATTKAQKVAVATDSADAQQQQLLHQYQRHGAAASIAAPVVVSGEPSAANNGQPTKTSAGQTSGHKQQQLEELTAAGCSVPKALELKDKRSKKSASGLDLGQSASALPSSGLASYYRSVASKVISNGQSKIKSFKDEMIKLNNRTSSAKRISMVIQPAAASTEACNSQQQHQQQQQRLALSGSVFNLSSLAPDSPASSVQQTAATNNCAQQTVDHPATEVAAQTPEVKPRTSILKNKQQRKQDNACDINNNNNEHDNGNDDNLRVGASASVSQQAAASGRRVSKLATLNGELSREAQVKQQAAKTTRAAKSTLKPKSILKTSKSVSNIASATSEQSYSHYRDHNKNENDDRDGDFSGQEQQLGASLREKRTGESSAHKQQQQVRLEKSSSSSVASDLGSPYAQRRCLNGGEHEYLGGTVISRRQPTVAGGARILQHHQANRRSTYSIGGDRRPTLAAELPSASVATNASIVGRQKDYDDEDADNNDCDETFDLDDDEESARSRDQAFERLRQRASCYDISRLMSKNGLQSQLNKLRIGSASSVAGRSRQRRPALLLDASCSEVDQQEPATMTATATATAPSESARRLGSKRISVVVNGTTAAATVASKTTSSGADGMVRAKVSAAQPTKQSASSLSVSSQESSAAMAAAAAGAPDELRGWSPTAEKAASRAKKLEFEPRSLRRMPAEYAKLRGDSSGTATGTQGQTAAAAAATEASVKAERRKSVTSIRLLSMRSHAADSAVDLSRHEETKTQAKTKGTKSLKRSESIQQVNGAGSRKGEHTSVVCVTNRELKEAVTSCGSSQEDSATEDESPTKVAHPLSKSGPFSLLRQSFNQKTLSSMLRFSGRASLRVKSAAEAPTTSAGTTSEQSGAEATSASTEKATAIALAEAKLLAAKQLKQQAQKLKEQQKRELQQQQQQQAALDPGMVLAAVQYNQQVMQRQQQQQQQQQQQHHHHQQQQQALLFQQAQQYAAAAAVRGHHHTLFDASTVHMQHQMLIQRQQQQQQQQQAYYMAAAAAQQMAVMQQAAAAPMLSMPTAQPLMYVPSGPIATLQASARQQHQQQAAAVSASSSIFRKSILKSSSKPIQQQRQQQMMYQSQAAPAAAVGQQLIPMAVNHHSSFNIVYTGSTSSQIPQPQLVYHEDNNSNHHHHQQQQQTASSTVSRSLGASMRKTVKSILNNRSAFGLSASSVNLASDSSSEKTGKRQEVKLKSVLKTTSSASRDLVLNSEGSDGDGSSSDSTTVNSPASNKQVAPVALPKSALKKPQHHHQQEISSSASSDSSLSSGVVSSNHGFHQLQQGNERKSTLTRGFDYRQASQAVKLNGADCCDSAYHSSQANKCQAKRRSQQQQQQQQQDNGTHTTTRKNVTFSAKLTSIL